MRPPPLSTVSVTPRLNTTPTLPPEIRYARFRPEATGRRFEIPSNYLTSSQLSLHALWQLISGLLHALPPSQTYGVGRHCL